MNRGRRIAWSALLVAGFLLVAAAWRWIEAGFQLLLDRDSVLAWLTSFGVWAPVVFIGVSALQVVLAPIPGQFIGVAGGYLFGVWRGLLYSLIGTSLGAWAAMWLGRRFGRPLVTRLAGEPALARFDRFADRRGPLFFFLVFLLPFVPDDLAFYAIGLSPLPILPMLIMATVVRLPAALVSTLVGDNIARLPLELLILGLIGVVTAGVFIWKYQEKIEMVLMRWIRRMALATSDRRDQDST
ncbi:MAG TPA: VTT domain-containing protein [Anaerolineae bacterium]|nr:VTT domain-containing protein [Anaerolineae bacterium]